ncbi:MAG: hypothetical protein ACK5Q5_07385 [Planctomycetaceae bacterium]
MSVATLQRGSLVIPLDQGSFSICILHRGRWHATSVDKPFADVIDMAEDAHRRSGLPVQIRNQDETILFEACIETRSAAATSPSCRDTQSF